MNPGWKWKHLGKQIDYQEEHMKRNKYWSAAALLAIIAMLAAACAPAATATAVPTTVPTSKPANTAAPAATTAPTGGIDCMGAKSGDSVSMLYQWSGTE